MSSSTDSSPDIALKKKRRKKGIELMLKVEERKRRY
jgi:hypothetical protein